MYIFLFIFIFSLGGCALDFDKFPSESSRPDTDQSIMPDMFVADMMTVVQVDSDDDGIFDRNDNCPAQSNEDQSDLDADGEGDVCDDDIDGDRIDNEDDVCPENRDPEQNDLDADGEGDACDADIDGDGVLNDDDNCVREVNPDQLDLDRDGLADACDDDLDNDGLSNEEEGQLGTDPRRPDTDADGVSDLVDTCPLIVDPTNTDADNDGFGRVCDIDDDSDGIFDYQDNCLGVANPDQTDSDNNQEGDDCVDDYDGDGILLADDNCPFHPNPDQTMVPCSPALTVHLYDRRIGALDRLGNTTFATTQESIRRIDNGVERLVASNFLSNRIKPTDIFPRADDRIFVASDHELFVYHEVSGVQFSLMGLPVPESFNERFSTIIYYNDQVWAGNDASLFRLAPTGWEEVSEISSVTAIGGVLDMAVGPQSRLWVLFADGVAIFEGDTLLCDEELACPALPMDANSRRGLSVVSNNHIWVYSDVGAERYNFNALQDESFRGPEVFGLTGQDDLWVLSAVNLYRVDGDRRALPEVTAPLPASELTAIVSQQDESILLGSVNGIRRYESFLTTLSDKGLPPDGARFGPCIVDGLRANGQVWVASRDRVTVIAPDGTDRVLTVDDLLNGEPTQAELEIAVMRLVDNSVWIGSNEGISVVNPTELTLTTHYKEQLPLAPVTDILEHAPTNTVWVSTEGGGIAYLRGDGTWPRVSEVNNLRHNSVYALAASNSRIYAATFLGPSAINPTNGTVDDIFNFGNELAEQEVRANDIYFDQSSNRLFVATSNGLAIRTGTTWEIFQRATGGLPFNSGTEEVRAVSFDGEYMWLVLRKGETQFFNGTIVRRRPSLMDTTGILQFSPDEIGMPNTDSTDAVRLNISDGELFIATCGRSGDREDSGGLSLLPGRNIELERFSQESLVGFSPSQSRLVSGFGGVPLSTGLTHEGLFESELITPNGLESVVLPDDDFQSGPTACADDPLQPDTTLCIFPRTPVEPPPGGGIGLRSPNANGFQWSVTDAGTFRALKDGDLRDVAFDDNGVAWIISRQGLIRYAASGTQISLVSQATEPEMISDDILSLAIDGTRIAIGTDQGVLIYRPNAEESMRWTRPTGLNAQQLSLPAKALAFDSGGRLFVGTSDGLFILGSTHAFEREYTVANGLFSNGIESIVVAADGRIYVGSTGGLNLYDDATDSWAPVVVGDILGGDGVFDLFEASDNRIWLRTTSGIGRLN